MCWRVVHLHKSKSPRRVLAPGLVSVDPDLLVIGLNKVGLCSGVVTIEVLFSRIKKLPCGDENGRNGRRQRLTKVHRPRLNRDQRCAIVEGEWATLAGLSAARPGRVFAWSR